MNKKGDVKFIFALIIGVVFLIFITSRLFAAGNADSRAKTCSAEDCTVSLTSDCPGETFDPISWHCADKDKRCCTTVEHLAQYKSASGDKTDPETGLPEGVEIIRPLNGSISIRMGADVNELSGAATLKEGIAYTFNVRSTGDLTTCTVKILDGETRNEITGTSASWINVAGSGCSGSGIQISATPTIDELNKQYQIVVEAKDAKDRAMTKTIQLNVVPLY